MPTTRRAPRQATGWSTTPDPDGRYSTGIPDFDRLLGGGHARGSFALFSLDESVGLEDLDRLLFPTYLNILYHSRGIIAVLPARDSPHGFRSRLTRYVTRRRFDSRVRICDYVGEDQGLSYVVNLNEGKGAPDELTSDPKERDRAIAKMVRAERAAQGERKRGFLELFAFEVFDTLMGSEKALKMFYLGIKRTRTIGNLGIGLLGAGLDCAPGVRRMVDTEFALHRDEVGLLIRGVRPAFPSHLVTDDPVRGAPHVSFVPRPA